MKLLFSFFLVGSLALSSSFVLAQAADAPAQIEVFSDYKTALSEAGKNGKYTLMVFAGSDWCKPCKAFKQAVLDDPTFNSELADDINLLYLDFPSKRKNQLSKAQKDHNEALAERFNPSGIFPTIILIQPNETVMKSMKYNTETGAEFVGLVNIAAKK